MGSIRAFFNARRKLALMLVGLTLAIKMLVPAGFMVATQGLTLTVQICTDGSGEHLTQQIVIPMENHDAPGQGEHGKADQSCPFSGLTMASLAGTDAALLLTAIAFIMTLGFAPVRCARPRGADYLRPPLRGPPARV